MFVRRSRWVGWTLALLAAGTLGCGESDGGEDDGADASDADGDADADADGDADAGSEGESDGDADSGETGDTSTTGDDQGTETGAGDYDVWELRWDNFPVPQQETSYLCFEFSATLDQVAHIVGFKPAIDNAPYVHHYLVSTIPQATGNPPGTSCFDIGGDLIWGWAPGQGEYLLPEQAGLLAGDGPSGQLNIRIQVHFNNPLGTSGEVDSSGIDVYLSQELREFNAGSMVFADVGGITIPPGMPAYEHIADCTSLETLALLNGPITVFASSMHAHDIGSVLWTDIMRDGQFHTELNRDDPFRFDNQTYKPVDSIVIQPGDEVINHCIYDSTGRTNTTQGGPATSDEMCWNTSMYYPRENANFFYCGS